MDFFAYRSVIAAKKQAHQVLWPQSQSEDEDVYTDEF